MKSLATLYKINVLSFNLLSDAATCMVKIKHMDEKRSQKRVSQSQFFFSSISPSLFLYPVVNTHLVNFLSSGLGRVCDGLMNYGNNTLSYDTHTTKPAACKVWYMVTHFSQSFLLGWRSAAHVFCIIIM